jgi:hypothetical protein
MDMATFIVFAVSVWIAWLTMQTARRRGRSATAWMWLGILFGPFAWLAVAMLPSIRKHGDGPSGGNTSVPAESAPAATTGKIATGRSRGLLLRAASA